MQWASVAAKDAAKTLAAVKKGQTATDALLRENIEFTRRTVKL